MSDGISIDVLKERRENIIHQIQQAEIRRKEYLEQVNKTEIEIHFLKGSLAEITFLLSKCNKEKSE